LCSSYVGADALVCPAEPSSVEVLQRNAGEGVRATNDIAGETPALHSIGC